MEARAFTGFPLRRDGAQMVVHYFFTDGQPNAGTLIFVPPVQALKNIKYFFAVGRIEPNAIVFDGDPVPVVCLLVTHL